MAKNLKRVNNDFYDQLGERWLTAQDDPVALLRTEGIVKQAWMESQLQVRLGTSPLRILDIGCGAGFWANRMADLGHRVQGLDYSFNSLRMARISETSGTLAQFHRGDALRLPFQDASFDVVCAMDFLEHVENPGAVIFEASRVLKPSGLFFFHTFNRNFLAWLIIIKGLEWFVRNTPKDMHVLRLFITPKELEDYCNESGMKVLAWTGVRPDIMRTAFWKMLFTGVVPRDFRFVLTPSLRLSYLGVAEKERFTEEAQPPN